MQNVADVVQRLKRPAGAARLPALIVMTDSVWLSDPIAVVPRIPRGAAIIVRHYDMANRRDLARTLINVCRPRGIRVLIAGDARLACAVDADGLHLPEWMVRRDRRWRGWRRRDWIVTAAAHGPAAIQHASAAGVDAVLVSPVFTTRSHPGASPVGPTRLATWAQQSSVAVYALGGIEPQTARRLLAIPLAGMAGIGNVLSPTFSAGAAKQKGGRSRPSRD